MRWMTYRNNINFVEGIDALLEIREANATLDEMIARLRGLRHAEHAFHQCVFHKHANEEVILAALADENHSVNGDPLEKAFTYRKEDYEGWVGGRPGRFPDHFEPLSDKDGLICALHGSTWSPVATRRPITERELHDYYVGDARYDLLAIAYWIGELKRHRHAQLDRSIVVPIKSYYELNADCDGALQQEAIGDRLSGCAWDLILAGVDQMIDNPDRAPIDVVYEWASEENQPWTAERDGDTIKICGPLLDFPNRQAARWNELADRRWNPNTRVFW